MPEELPIVIGGALTSARRQCYWWIMLPVCIVGVIIGDSFLYLIGRFWGRSSSQMPFIRKRLLPPERFASIAENSRSYGVKILLFARLTPGIRAPIFLTAGITKLPITLFPARRRHLCDPGREHAVFPRLLVHGQHHRSGHRTSRSSSRSSCWWCWRASASTSSTFLAQADGDRQSDGDAADRRAGDGDAGKRGREHGGQGAASVSIQHGIDCTRTPPPARINGAGDRRRRRNAEAQRKRKPRRMQSRNCHGCTFGLMQRLAPQT